MSGFLDPSLNQLISTNTLKYIISKLIVCMEMMSTDCAAEAQRIDNNEIVIRDFLFSNYLDNDDKMQTVGLNDFRFESEAPENYINGVPQGRADLKVYSIDDFRHRKRYFIIECKRIDGNLTLNREYVDNGIRRFIGLSPKYTSYYNSNCMFGFLVKTVDIGKNVDCINQLLCNDYGDIPVQDYLHLDIDSDFYLSTHGDKKSSQVALIHAFADCSKLVN